MSIRANNTHIIFNDATNQNTAQGYRIVSVGTGESLIANVADGVVTLKVIVRSGGTDFTNTTHYWLAS